MQPNFAFSALPLGQELIAAIPVPAEGLLLQTSTNAARSSSGYGFREERALCMFLRAKGLQACAVSRQDGQVLVRDRRFFEQIYRPEFEQGIDDEARADNNHGTAGYCFLAVAQQNEQAAGRYTIYRT